MGEVSDVPLRSASTACTDSSDEKPICHSILPAFRALFVPGDLTPLPTISTIQARGRRWLTHHNPSEVPGSEGGQKFRR